MPQKLIRLTCQSGDGVFSGLFNQDIEIKENSEIALQSLSVEKESQEIVITNGNNTIDFASVAQSDQQIGRVTPLQTYNANNNDELFNGISAGMNRTCDLESEKGQWGIQHKVSVNDGGNVQIVSRNSPFYQIQKPVNCDFIVNNRPTKNNIADAEILNIWKEFQGAGLLKSLTEPAFATGLYIEGTQDKNVGSYTNIALTSNLLGTGATIDFTVIQNGVGPIPFGAGFDPSGANTADKSNGTYTNISLLKANGSASGIRINFTVAAGGDITFASIVINVSGSGIGGDFVKDDILRIDNSITGGTQDTYLKVVNVAGLVQFSSIRVNNIGDEYEIGEILTIPNTDGIGGTADTEIKVSALEAGGGEAGMWRATDTTTGGGGTEPNLNEAYVFGTEPITKSTGIFRTRFKRLNTDGAGTASFTMGLVKGQDGLNKLKSSTLLLGDIEYAIRVNGHASPMQYINKKGGDFINTVTPLNHTTADWEQNLNDVLDIRVVNGTIKGVITSQTAGTPLPPPTPNELNPLIDFDITEDYFWFISLHEGKDNCVLDLTGVTLDPFYGLQYDTVTGGYIPTAARENNEPHGIIEPSEIVDLPDIIDQAEFYQDFPFQPNLTLSETLGKYLGFENVEPKQYELLPPVGGAPPYTFEGNDYFIRTGYIYTAENGFDNSYDSDTYIIETQTFTLDCFDSYGLNSNERFANSGGSRRNIIATIPINEIPIIGTPNSIIQFQPNTLFYVAIKNRGSINTRQIRCKLLSGMYQPVKTQGLASIVLLIKEP